MNTLKQIDKTIFKGLQSNLVKTETMNNRTDVTTQLTQDLIQLYTDRYFAEESDDQKQYEYISRLIFWNILRAREIFTELGITDEDISFLEDIQGIAKNIGTMEAQLQSVCPAK
tara:strand:+ start:623 stop:964 length:342 start_codon:yes stop_codon:yes gene_type:complete